MSAEHPGEHQQATLHRRRLGRRGRRPHVRGSRSVHRRARGRGRSGHPRGRAPRGRGGSGSGAGLGADSAGRAPGHLLEGRRRAREPPGRGRLAARARDRVHVRLRHVPDALRAGALPPDRGARLRAGRRGDPVRHGRLRDGAAPAGRRRRGDRPLERRADPVRPLDRGAARARQHRRAQAVRVVAHRRRPDLGRDLRRGRAARRRAQHRAQRAWRGGPDRRRARREPARAPAQLHRLDRQPAASWPRRRAGSSSGSCWSSAATTR